MYQQNFRKTTSKKSIFRVGDSKSVSKILEKQLQRNFHFRKLFCIYEQNLWNTSEKEFFFFLQFTILLVILFIVHNPPLLKCFGISFSKPPSTSGHKWSKTHRVLKSHRSKMCIIYMQSWKQCALPLITTMALWQLMHWGTWRMGKTLSWITYDHLYISTYILLYKKYYQHQLLKYRRSIFTR